VGRTQRRLSPRVIGGVVAACAVLLVAACSSGGGSTGGDSGPADVTYINNNGIPMPASAAATNGFFTRAGLNVTMKSLPTGTDSIGGMIGGSADFVLAGDTRLVQAASQNLPIEAVGLAQTGYPSYLMVPAKDTTTKGFADLVGKKISVEVGSSQQAGLVRYLQAIGLDPHSFQFVNVKNADSPTALSSGAVDAAVFPDPYAHASVFAGLTRAVVTPQEMTAKAGVQWPFLLVTTKAYAQAHPATVQKFVDAWVCTKNFLQSNPDQATTLMTAALKSYDPRVVETLEQVTNWKPQVIDQALVTDIQAQAKALIDLGTLKSVPDLNGYIDNSFVEKAMQTGCPS
jgi:NitT/TauT family transport system substrate-binding protein